MMTRMILGFTLALSLLAAPLDTAYGESENVMTESELANVLAEVLGLSTMLPANPSDAEVFSLLLANEISPRDGWNADGVVTVGTLSRILVQSMGRADEIENPDDDNAWVAFLASIGIEFGTVQDAIDQVDPLAQPVANLAIVVSTDPLRKVPNVNQGDAQQLGADLMDVRRPVMASAIPVIIEEATRTEIRRRPTPPPMTPWWFRR